MRWNRSLAPESFRRTIIGALSALGLVLALQGCAGHTTILSVSELDCGSCGPGLAGQVTKLDGVSEARFDLTNAELAVDHDPEVIDAKGLVKALYKAGFDVTIGPGKGSYGKDVKFPPGVDLAWLTRTGEYVDVTQHLVPNKVTIFDYGAKWCGPCRKVDAEMARVLPARSDVALRKLNVVDWDSPLAQRALKGVPALPYLIVYDASGRRVDAIAGLDLKRLKAAIAKASGKASAQGGAK